MNCESEECESRRFSDRTYAIPFGRYEAGTEAEPPANDILIGREKQRAFFLDVLLRSGRRGAFLVTGHRGVGKTSFVRYCLREHQEEVFERFLRSSVGRTFFWDRFAVLALGAIAVLLALALTEFSEAMVTVARNVPGDQINLLAWLVVLPLFIGCAFPLLYAWELATDVLAALWPKRRAIASPIGFAAVAVLAALFWLLGPFGAPGLSASRCFAAVGGLYLWVRCTSFERPRPSKGGTLQESLRRLGWINLLFVCGELLLVIFGSPITPKVTVWNEIVQNLSLGFFFGFLGTWIQGIHQRRPHDSLSRPARAAGGSWYLWSGALGALAAAAFLLITASEEQRLYLIAVDIFVPALALILFLLCRSWHRSRKLKSLLSTSTGDATPAPRFRPRPLAALGIKSLLSIVVGLQLIHPVLSQFHLKKPAYAALKAPLRRPVSLAEVPGCSMGKATGKIDPSDQCASLFEQKPEEQSWVIAVFLLLIVTYFLEYEWVVRPFLPARADPAIDPGPPGQEPDRDLFDRRTYRQLARLTLPWMLYRAWLPIITISVNLGFERLDHRRVVQAMLTGLRARYQRTFLGWNSGIANLVRGIALIVLLIVTNLAGERWFHLPDESTLSPRSRARLATFANNGYPKTCALLKGSQKDASAAHLICSLPWGQQVFNLLYFNLLQSKSNPTVRDHRLLVIFRIIPYDASGWPLKTEARPQLFSPGMHFRVYHLLLLSVFYFLARWLFRRIPIAPYRETVRRIDNVLDSLISSTSQTSRLGRWQPSHWIQGFLMSEQVRQTQQEPLDPRAVEFLFLQILEEVQEAVLRLPGARHQLVSFPVPEITFVFDELDKLGTRIEPQELTAGDVHQAEILYAERRRSMELHKLLADMKNLFSAAPARFIFVGGRNLHDEWLADQTSRQPILTNIFNAEIYLPSLLTDFCGGDKNITLVSRVEDFLRAQWVRAAILHQNLLLKRYQPSFSLRLEDRKGESFVSPTELEQRVRELRPGTNVYPRLSELQIIDVSSRGLKDDEQVIGRNELLRDFVQALTYRSMGNPKRLRELVGARISPVGREVMSTSLREMRFPCDHVLVLDDAERHRIQLLARIYRHLLLTFESFVHRDDKLTVSAFFLADFLMKFHRRAFSWRNLERVEDLAHIHRAPDLREVLETIVEQWTERFLHRIRNGMYDFRFRSELAREIRYVSSQSPPEMAAFNFTLDESQALKSVYETTIRKLKEQGVSQGLQDFVAGLGELHEFDQEYEIARHYYRHAISLLDADLRTIAGGSMVFEEESPMLQAIASLQRGASLTRLYLTWSIARLRLMLQIGMTYELARDFEQASVEYDSAVSLARSVILALLDNPGREKAKEIELLDGNVQGDNRLDALKHLFLLFQPIFALAWVAEKMAGAVDTSVSLLEQVFRDMRSILPFIRDNVVDPAVGPGEIKHKNLSLISAEFHNKTGDLYFFKGRQLMPRERVLELSRQRQDDRVEAPRHGQEGYLLKAHAHYAIGLHDLRRFTAYRKSSSATLLNLKREKPWETIEAEGWPDYVLRSVGGTLNDFAEVMLGRVSIFWLLRNLQGRRLKKDLGGERQVPRSIERLVDACTAWMEELDGDLGKADSVAGTRILISFGTKVLDAGTLSGWFGAWNGSWDGQDPKSRLVLFDEWSQHDDLERICVAFNFMLVGARYLEKGGYLEDAAREYLKVSEAAVTYLSWIRTLRRLAKWNSSQPVSNKILELDWELLEAKDGRVLKHPFWPYLKEISLFALTKANQLFHRSRRGPEDGYLIASRIPVGALVNACSLGLLLNEPDPASKDLEKKLKDLVRSWIGANEAKDIFSTNRGYELLLRRSLERHSFPMLARMIGLKALIDNAVVADPLEDLPVLSWANELKELAGRLNSPLHFTPLQLGVTAALVYLFGSEDENTLEDFRQLALRELLRSEEMYTLRRGFYESISDLFYLYDDFNDRQIHFNHAIQMAGSELVSLLRSLASRRDFVEETPFVLPRLFSGAGTSGVGSAASSKRAPTKRRRRAGTSDKAEGSS